MQVKPSGKREVVVTLKGVHPNTRDDGVMDYLAKFGRLTSTKVVYAVFREGPLKGIRNGDRMYKIEIKPNSYLGTYHVIDGQRVTARYPGQQQTCARCFGSPQSCPGKGIAKRCEQEGGLKVEFNGYIQQLWNKIGYIPAEVELDPDINSEHASQVSDQFTPAKSSAQDSARYTGVRISTFPKDVDNGKIVEFLINSGLSESYKENISVKYNGSVLIEDLPNMECQALISAIHSKHEFGRKLYCNGVIPRTPDKLENSQNCSENTPAIAATSSSPAPSTSASCSLSSVPSPASPTICTSSSQCTNITAPCISSRSLGSSQLNQAPHQSLPQDHQGVTVANMVNISTDTITTSVCKPLTSVEPGLVSPMSPNTFTQQYSETPDIQHLHLSNQELVRRNSMCLRSPPAGSLADEILSSDPKSNYSKAKSILSSLKDMADRYSDFASCDSSLGDTDTEAVDITNEVGFQYQGRKKKSKKHRLSPSPTKDFFLKRPNTASSPESRI